METKPSLADRFWSKVDVRGPDECWPWLKSADYRGCGRFSINRKNVRAPRFAWQLAHGQPLPEGLCACHSCDNPNCVNPAHLWAGTQSENMLDMMEKGRAPGRPRRSHCKRGHELTDANVYVNAGSRNCRECKRTVWRGKPLEQEASA